MAEGAFGYLAVMRGVSDLFEVESAGTVCYQSGSAPDHRAVCAAGEYGIDISGIRARCIDDLDLDGFDRIFVMDSENLRDLLDALDGYSPRVHLMTDFSGTHAGHEIEDPYYGDEKGFDSAMQLIMHSARGILGAMLVEYALVDSGKGSGASVHVSGDGDE